MDELVAADEGEGLGGGRFAGAAPELELATAGGAGAGSSDREGMGRARVSADGERRERACWCARCGRARGGSGRVRVKVRSARGGGERDGRRRRDVDRTRSPPVATTPLASCSATGRRDVRWCRAGAGARARGGWLSAVEGRSGRGRWPSDARGGGDGLDRGSECCIRERSQSSADRNHDSIVSRLSRARACLAAPGRPAGAARQTAIIIIAPAPPSDLSSCRLTAHHGQSVVLSSCFASGLLP